MNLDELRHTVRMKMGEQCTDKTCRVCQRNIAERDAVLAALDVIEAVEAASKIGCPKTVKTALETFKEKASLVK